MPAQNSEKVEKLEEEVFFHIFNKGVDNRILFKDNKDYETFLNFLKEYLSPPPDPNELKQTFSVNGRTFKGVPHHPKNYFNKVELVAYSLSPNHFRLLLKPTTKGSLEKLIRSLSTRYAIYYNKKYQRRGSLFVRPYKSIQLKNAPQLVYLTRSFHRVSQEEGNKNGYSSYEIYLKEKTASWVKPNYVISLFKKLKSDSLKKAGTYKNFVEKYELDNNEKKMIESIIIETIPSQLDSVPVSKPDERASTQTVQSIPTPEPRTRITEFIATTTIAFILLFGIGFRNVLISANETTGLFNSAPSPEPKVSGLETEDVLKPSPSPTPTPQVSGIKTEPSEEAVNISVSPTPEVSEINSRDSIEFLANKDLDISDEKNEPDGPTKTCLGWRDF
jgi:hypothetical protein